MKKLLLTGASGFIGSHILEHLLIHTDWHITCIASWKHKGTPERIESVLKPEWNDRVQIITHDLISPIPERTAARIGKCDYIINCGSESHVERSIEDPVPFIQNNVNLVLNVLEFARKYPCESFIQLSTDEVYGPTPDGEWFKEWSPIVPSNPYSASKAAQEAIAISYWRTYGIPVILTNTENNFGETQDQEKYIAKLIRLISKGETVPVHKSGSRFYLHARNHADALLFILKNLPATKYVEGVLKPDRYNVVGETEMDNLSMAKFVAKLMDKELKYEVVDFHATRPGHDRRYALDGSKLNNLGWKEPVKFNESLKKYIDWTLTNSIWL